MTMTSRCWMCKHYSAREVFYLPDGSEDPRGNCSNPDSPYFNEDISENSTCPKFEAPKIMMHVVKLMVGTKEKGSYLYYLGSDYGHDVKRMIEFVRSPLDLFKETDKQSAVKFTSIEHAKDVAQTLHNHFKKQGRWFDGEWFIKASNYGEV